MANYSEPSQITPSEWLLLNQFLYEIKKVNSPCISVYYPYGSGKQTISMLHDSKRDESFEEIESKIEQKILKLADNPTTVGKFVKTLCVFGWRDGGGGSSDGKIIVKAVGTAKKLPFIYMATKRPYLKPFRDILKTSYDVTLITIDQKSARIQIFRGSQLVQESKLQIDLQGRHKKGGQSQGRFLRARQTKIHVFFKKVANKVYNMSSDSELILLGGPGPAKTVFYDELHSELAKKCQFVEELSFSTPIDDIRKKIIHHLYHYRRRYVEELVQKYDTLIKQGLTARRNAVIYKALQIGAVDTLIVSANYRSNTTHFKNIVKMLDIAKSTLAKIEFVMSPRIIKRLDIDDSVLAILRYRIK